MLLVRKDAVPLYKWRPAQEVRLIRRNRGVLRSFS